MATTSQNLAGKVVLVTGAVRNIGLDIARAFVEAGAIVYVNGRTDQSVQRAVEQLTSAATSGGKAIGVVCDVSDPSQVAAMFATIRRESTRLDVLVNNAAALGITGLFHEVTDEQFDQVMRTNVYGLFRCCREAARIMVEQRQGAIIAIGSNVTHRAIRRRSAYVAGKGALEAMIRAIAVDLGPYGVRANVVAAGYVHTDRWDALDDAALEMRRANIPLGCEATGADIAQAAVFLASPQAANISGITLTVDGGCCAQHMPAERDR